MRDKWHQHSIIAVSIAVILISAVSIGYASLAQYLNVEGYATLRTNKDVRVTGITNNFESCGSDVFNPKYSENSITINGELPNLECTLEYTFKIKNDDNFAMEIVKIDEESYNNLNILYEFVDFEVGSIILENSEQDFKIKFYYNSELTEIPLETKIGAIFSFEFDYAETNPYENPFIEDGLILLYDGINNSGKGFRNNVSSWKDLVGTNNGELVGNPEWENDSLKFDGVDDKVEFKGDIPENYTIISTFEVDPDYGLAYQRIFAENPFPSLCINANGDAWLYGHGIDVVFPNSVKLEGKIKIAMTYDGASIKLYIDGFLMSSISVSNAPTSTARAFLGGRATNDRQFKGNIYNFMIYDRVLTEEEIIANTNAIKTEKIIFIKTVAQLLKIGSNENVIINNEEYKFTKDAKYIVQNNLAFSYNGIWEPDINTQIDTNDKIITITNTNDGSVHYFQNHLYVTKDNAIKNGLMLHYDGINNTGSGHSNNSPIWKDLKGTNDGILIGDISWSNNGLDFDGVDDRVEFVGDITNNYSFVVTIKPEMVGIHPRIFSENPFPTLYMNSNSNHRLAFYGQGRDNAFSPSIVPSPTHIIYVVVTYDGAEIILYVNGKKIGLLTTTTNPVSTAIAYLGGNDNLTRQYKGKIYNFMIYNRTLSELEVERSYITNRYKYK